MPETIIAKKESSRRKVEILAKIISESVTMDNQLDLSFAENKKEGT